MSESTKELKSENIWVRLLYMILFVAIFGVAEFVMYIVAVIGFFLKLFGKDEITTLRETGHYVAVYINEIAEYLTFNTDVRPFPFSDWPGVADSVVKDSGVTDSSAIRDQDHSTESNS